MVSMVSKKDTKTTAKLLNDIDTHFLQCIKVPPFLLISLLQGLKSLANSRIPAIFILNILLTSGIIPPSIFPQQTFRRYPCSLPETLMTRFIILCLILSPIQQSTNGSILLYISQINRFKNLSSWKWGSGNYPSATPCCLLLHCHRCSYP